MGSKNPFKGKGKEKGFKGKANKNASIKKEGEKLTCKHCSKEGHDEAHCWKLHPEMKLKKFNNKGKQKTTATTQHDLGSNSSSETKITAMGMKGKESISSTSISKLHNETPNEKKRIELFHIKVISQNRKMDTLFYSGSQANLSENIVKILNMETIPHHKPYPLGWVCDNAQLQVTRKCKLKFIVTANFIDEVELNVVPLDICGIVLGSLYLYEKKIIFHRHEKKYICSRME